MDEAKYLAIDVGGTNLKYGLIDRSGQLIKNGRVTTPRDCLASFIEQVNRVVDDLHTQIKGIAFSTPGTVEQTTQTIHCPDAELPYLDTVCLQDQLAKYHIPVGIENDGKCAALAELWIGNLADVQNGAAIVLGTCVGGGIILNNHLWAGRHRNGGEVSFMPSNQQDYSNDGLFGYTCSAVRMIKKIAHQLHITPETDGEAVFEAINAHDPVAWPIFETYCQQVASLILNMQTVLDLDRFVIGGGISAQPIVVDEINRAYDAILARRDWVRLTIARPEIMATKYRNDANLYGALYNLLNQLDETHDAAL
ncbi:hypothetical protein IV38_GL001795 [Lactobacillus selangorensis]|uniref:Sugar kinase and transcription regulator n=1 Tax=Lactobacillus selangorensis TaxID=81857 RepID=A0A0R2FR48_9LACO|nr:ROK family protein [Lactobacillus selangorensis]KRN27955.1 hypothetical protein IV38_GL001795 [Lactobacillus selangorensis]KRN30574.1 hypothetical protein IV40_GL001761 [Lactobacillus selangorensis]